MGKLTSSVTALQRQIDAMPKGPRRSGTRAYWTYIIHFVDGDGDAQQVRIHAHNQEEAKRKFRALKILSVRLE